MDAFSFNCSLDDLPEGFDPLLGSGTLPGIGLEGGATAASCPAADTRTSRERIGALFASLASQAETLRAVLERCSEATPMGDLEDMVRQLQAHTLSVFAGANLCAQLERLGALERVGADGTPWVDAAEEEIVVDGVEYLAVPDTCEPFWLTTAQGRAYVEESGPMEAVRDLFRREATYLSIYERILRMVGVEGGRSVADIAQAVNSDPLLKSPRLFAQRFLEDLKVAGAVRWSGTWQLTEAGRQVLDTIFAASADGE